jgi:hypothetical protein
MLAKAIAKTCTSLGTALQQAPNPGNLPTSPSFMALKINKSIKLFPYHLWETLTNEAADSRSTSISDQLLH